MVANQPIERPKSTDFLINQFRDLQRQVDELTRQSKYPVSIAHAGVPDLTVLPNADNSGAIVSIYDGAGHVLFRTDPDAKFGLAAPETPVPLYQAIPGLVFTGNTAFTQLWTGQFTALNSSFMGKWVVNTSYGGVAPSAISESYMRLSNEDSSYAQVSPTFTSATVGAGSATEYVTPWALTLPATVIGQRLYIDILARMKQGGASSAVALVPQFATGISRATAVSNGAT
ncbi:hypothetical protein ACIOD2_27295 [Amycolatopsis sp. NPDC088138]|uniref:hypothetical protein n=1 Tax=Amycolatopsis sp. NPDC088138 TaxID=3363938 RepID=UPI00382392F6